MNDLSRIFIRVNIGRGWESLSLKELYDIGSPESYQAILQWLSTKIYDALGIQENLPLTEEVLQEAINRLEKIGSPIIKVKSDLKN